MRRFHFRLEKILTIRKHREREAELVLAEITGICMALRNGIEERKTEMALFRGAEAGSVDLRWLQARELYRRRLTREIEDLSTRLAEREKERDEKTLLYLAASRERKVLDKLKERKGREYYAAQSAEEIKVIDDISGGMGIRAAYSGAESAFGVKE